MWLGNTDRRSYLFADASTDGGFEVLSREELPASRHQVLKYTSQQMVSHCRLTGVPLPKITDYVRLHGYARVVFVTNDTSVSSVGDLEYPKC